MLSQKDQLFTAHERHILANHWELIDILLAMQQTKLGSAIAAMQRLLELEREGVIQITQEVDDIVVIRVPDITVEYHDDIQCNLPLAPIGDTCNE